MRERVVRSRRHLPGPSLLITRPLRLALALLLVALGLTWAGTPPRAAADEPTALATITLTSMTPSVVEPGDTVKITGRVTNVSGRPLRGLSAYFWRSSFPPLTSREQLDAALQSASNDPLGERRAGFEQYDVLWSDENPTLADKASVDFSVEATTSELLGGSNPSNGVYLMGVHVLESRNNVAIGRSRILVPVVNPQLSNASSNSVRLSSLVMLTSAPSQLRPGVLADDRLAAEVASGGRLDQLLRDAYRPQTSYAVDPDLITELRTMSAGYQVAGADGQLTAGTGRSAATEWLRRFAALQSDHDGFRLPYAGYDLPALVRDDEVELAEQAEAAAKKVADVGDLPLLIAPAGGAAGADTLAAAKDLGARAVLLSDQSAGAAGPLLRHGDGPLVLAYDTDSTTGGPGPAPSDTPVHLRQSALAATYIESLTSAPGSTVGQLRVVNEPDQATGELDTASAPWLKLTDVDELLDGTPTSWDGKPAYSGDQRKAELASTSIRRATGVATDFGTYAKLLADPGDISTRRDQTLARLVSASWRGRPGAQRDFAVAQARDLDDVLRGNAVHLEAKNLVLTGTAGNIPVTVVNDLDQAIRVQVSFSSPNRQRLTVSDVPADTIGVVEARSRTPVTAEAQARANGKLPITAWLTTTDGTRVGRPLVIEVNPTQAGRIGWLISLGAGVVLVAATAFRIRQVRRERALQEAADG